MIVPTWALSHPYASDRALLASGKLYRAMYIAAYVRPRTNQFWVRRVRNSGVWSGRARGMEGLGLGGPVGEELETPVACSLWSRAGQGARWVGFLPGASGPDASTPPDAPAATLPGRGSRAPRSGPRP